MYWGQRKRDGQDCSLHPLAKRTSAWDPLECPSVLRTTLVKACSLIPVSLQLISRVSRAKPRSRMGGLSTEQVVSIRFTESLKHHKVESLLKLEQELYYCAQRVLAESVSNFLSSPQERPDSFGN